MKPYGMDRMTAGDDDVAGCIGGGRATRVAHIPNHGGAVATFRALREGKKAAVRRRIKRAARRENANLCRETE